MSDYCDCHMKHSKQLSDIDKLSKDHVSMKMFYFLIVIFLGTFSFQLLVYDTVRTIGTKVAVIEAKQTVVMTNQDKIINAHQWREDITK